MFLSGQYSNRKATALIGALAALGLGGFTLRYLWLAISHTQWSLQAVGSAAFIGGIGFLLAGSGVILFQRWFARTCLDLEISSTGIKYGKSFHPWEQIRWISGHREGTRIRLFYQTRSRGLGGFDRPLPMDPNPTAAEYEDLMMALEDALSAVHPHVSFG